MPKITLHHYGLMSPPDVQIDPQDNVATIHCVSENQTPVVLTMTARNLAILRERIDAALDGKPHSTEPE